MGPEWNSLPLSPVTFFFQSLLLVCSMSLYLYLPEGCLVNLFLAFVPECVSFTSKGISLSFIEQQRKHHVRKEWRMLCRIIFSLIFFKFYILPAVPSSSTSPAPQHPLCYSTSTPQRRKGLPWEVSKILVYQVEAGPSSLTLYQGSESYPTIVNLQKPSSCTQDESPSHFQPPPPRKG